jgi:hypothetical protein
MPEVFHLQSYVNPTDIEYNEETGSIENHDELAKQDELHKMDDDAAQSMIDVGHIPLDEDDSLYQRYDCDEMDVYDTLRVSIHDETSPDVSEVGETIVLD